MKIIAVDFDGCLCEDNWPYIGKPNQFIINELIRQKAEGAKIILWTCRQGEHLQAAVMWCINRGLRFDAINENLPENIQKYGNDCRKIFAHEYWDDKSVLTHGGDSSFMLWIRDDGNIHVRRWCNDTLKVKDVTLVEKIKRWWRK